MPTLYNYSLNDTLEPDINAAKRRVISYMKEDELGLTKYPVGAKDYTAKMSEADSTVKNLSNLIDNNKSALQSVKTFLQTDIANKSETEQTISASVKRYVAILNPVKVSLKKITKTLMSPKFNEEISFSELAPVADLKNSISELKSESDSLLRTSRNFITFVSSNVNLGNTSDLKRFTVKLDFERQKLNDEKNKLMKKLDTIINKNSKKLVYTLPLPRYETDAEFDTRVANEADSVQSLIDAVEVRILGNEGDVQQTIENLSVTNPMGFTMSVYPRVSKIKELLALISNVADEVNSINTGISVTFANFNQARKSIKDMPDLESVIGGMINPFTILATGTTRRGMGYDPGTTFDDTYQNYRISGLPMYI